VRTRTTDVTLSAIGVLVALALSAFCFITTETLPVGLLPAIAGDLHTSLSAAGNLVTAYGVTVAALSVPLVLATKGLSRRRLLGLLLATFVVTNFAAAAAPGYWTLLVVRIVGAMAQAVFWAVAAVVAAGLFPARLRGRVVASVFGGSSIGTIAGTPAGTWLGQQTSWRVPFVVLGALGLVAFAAILTLLRGTGTGPTHADTGTEPSRRNFLLLVAATTLAVTGVFTAFTYVTPFLTEVSRFSAAAVGPILSLRGVAGVGGLVLAGALIDRYPRGLVSAAIALLGLALGFTWLFGAHQVAVVILMCVFGLAMSGLVSALQSRVMQVAPGRADIASAGNSGAFNVGIAAGAFVGGLLLPHGGVRSTALAGALFLAAALATSFAQFASRTGPTPRSSADRTARASPGR
jgi:MFS transporter, DHA1 family, inner membrane transport protein